MQDRRTFLLNSAAASSALLFGSIRDTVACEAAEKPLRVLILGGTGYIGPHHVRAALARGHEVAIFNRGRRNDSDLPREVERLKGDRNGDLEAIRHRDWDAVLDLATFGPIWIRKLGEAMKDRVKHYSFISSNSVYDHPEGVSGSTREDAPVLAFSGGADPYALTQPRDAHDYGSLKALCEREAEQQFAKRTLIVRPGYIVGPGDPQGALTYWPVRMSQGGEALAVGDPYAPVQFIDVRDLAQWIIRMIERCATGTFNTVGPATPLTFAQMLAVAQTAAGRSVKTNWISSAWLAAQREPATWGKVLFWSYEPGGYLNTMRMSAERSLAQGLITRPLSATLADTLAWHQSQPEKAREEFSAAWNGDGTWTSATMAWPEYLRREKTILKAWRAQPRAGVC